MQENKKMNDCTKNMLCISLGLHLKNLKYTKSKSIMHYNTIFAIFPGAEKRFWWLRIAVWVVINLTFALGKCSVCHRLTTANSLKDHFEVYLFQLTLLMF